MRILILTNMYPPHAYGGYEQSCKDVTELWRSAGHEVSVLTSQARVPGVEVPPAEEPRFVRRDLHLYWEDHEILDPPLRRRFAWERSNLKFLEDALSEFKPDVVSAWAMGATSMGLLSRLGERGMPVVSVICDEWPVYGPMVDAWLRPLARRGRLAGVIRLLTRLPTTPPALDELGPACFVSDFTRRVVRERSQWRFGDSGVVYSGIAPDEFLFAPTARQWLWRLLYVGRIDPRKGIDTAVRALAVLPLQATLEICGSGDQRYSAELVSLASELGVSERVSFTHSERSQLGGHYSSADAIVFPPVWEEPFGLVPLEAMACGTPVIATRVGGSAEFLVDGRNCLAFPPGDVEGLVAAVSKLADDPELRQRLVEAGRSTAAYFTIDRLAEVLMEWHLYACGAPGANRPRDRLLPLVSSDGG